MALFGILGIIAGVVIPPIIKKVSSASYDRGGLDNIMDELLGKYKIKDALSHELLVVSYEYNSQEPRFYSKYFSNEDPNHYDVVIGLATGGSSAAPTFFDPKVVIDGYGYTEYLIDGGVICNNPALYAYQMARELHDKQKVRVLSLGTGEKPFVEVDPENFSFVTAMQKKDEFMMNMDTYTADWYMNHTMPADDYLRLQKTTKLGMDKVDPASIAGLQADGIALHDLNKEALEAMMRRMIDDKFGPPATITNSTTV